MKTSHFLWPQANLQRALLRSISNISIAAVEEKLSEMFKGGVPVLYASGRAALASILVVNNCSRKNKVGIFPFASHCVLDAVSRITTPCNIGNITKMNVVYQQWGYIQYIDLTVHDIEDCVDSLVLQGGKLFPGGGGYEVWSLPKILGTAGGAVLWCRSPEVADKLRELRDSKNLSDLMWFLRIMGSHSEILHSFWQGAEASLGRPSRFQMGEIYSALNLWDKIVEDRQEKFEILCKIVPKWLQKSCDRLPCIVPLEYKKNKNNNELETQLGISTGIRNIENRKTFCLEQVLPIPIHQDVSFNWLSENLKKIEDAFEG